MIISIAEARELLGESAKKMSDEEVVKITEDIDKLAQLTIDMYKSEKLRGYTRDIK